jgi:hypothetical protein
MTASRPPNPKLGKSTALTKAQGTSVRLSTLVPTLTSVNSPSLVYQPDAVGGVGNELTAPTGGSISGFYGVWVAPDLNGDGSEYTVQVECFGGGGGGGGGNASQGGGGGGGGEYACEDQYPVKPGNSYAWLVGNPGSGGYNNSTSINPGAAGTDGGTTVFDLTSLGLAGGVMAHGGQGGDQTSIGIGGDGGDGSGNSIHFPGGAGATNNSANGSDDPSSLIQISGSSYWTPSTVNGSSWVQELILNDDTHGTNVLNDASFTTNGAVVTNYSPGGLASSSDGVTGAPTQVPAYASTAETYGTNPTIAGGCVHFTVGQATKPSARILCSGFGLSGSHFTLAVWVQAPDGIWANNTYTGAKGLVASNRASYPGNTAGYSIYFQNTGTASSPVWTLFFSTGTGSDHGTISSPVPATPGTWYYIVCTFDSGVHNLWVNNVKVATGTTAYTSVPGGTYHTSLGLNPVNTNDQFFGYMSNFWAVNGNGAQSALIAQAYGLTPATGGGGGGASGGPSAPGGVGLAAAGATGGTGGSPPVQPASLLSTTTQSMGGFFGGNAGTGGGFSSSGGGFSGGGGGGSGDMPANPAQVTLQFPFPSAATYCGTDAGSNAGSLYNVNQQSNAGSGINSLLYSGGQASELASGTKNCMLLLPAGLAQQLGAGAWAIAGLFLTVTNAYPDNTVESILEIGYSSDTVLPETYTGASLTAYAGALPIPPGAGTITYDLSQSPLATSNILTNGTATALVIGPGTTPGFDAYNAPSGPAFYCAIYGPGAYDKFGNPQFPYLTVIIEKTLTGQYGSPGGPGGILITAVNNTAIPVGLTNAFAGKDDGGNQYAAGYTGTVTAFQPGGTPGAFVPETWHKATLASPWTGTGNGYNGFWYRMNPDGFCEAVFDVGPSSSVNSPSTIVSAGTIPSSYYPSASTNAGPCCVYGALGSGSVIPYLEISNTGQAIAQSIGSGSTAKLAGYIRWWPGTP